MVFIQEVVADTKTLQFFVRSEILPLAAGIKRFSFGVTDDGFPQTCWVEQFEQF